MTAKDLNSTITQNAHLSNLSEADRKAIVADVLLALREVASGQDRGTCWLLAAIEKGGGSLTHSALLKKSKMPCKDFRLLVKSGCVAGVLRKRTSATKGRTSTFYELA